MTMYLLSHLSSTDTPADQGENPVEVEFRLICQGVLYPSGIVGDWRKSDGARMLLLGPFQLLVASHPYDDFPQELALRFAARSVTERTDNQIRILRPTYDIASDLAAILTLLCRRLITVAVEVRRKHDSGGLPEPLRDYPLPIVGAENPSHWSRRPVHVVTGLHGQKITDYQPPPKGFDEGTVTQVLERLPILSCAEDIIRAARRYSLAMELVENRPEIAYQMLISAVETMAGAALNSWVPDEDQQLTTQGNVVKACVKAGLSEEAAREVALEACKGNPWSRRKFIKFVMDHVGDDVFETEDDLFIVTEHFAPKKEDLKKALSDVYSMRSGASHSGESFPASASIGPSPMLPSEAVRDQMAGKKVFPPIGWFERVVNSAFCNFIFQQIGNGKELSEGSGNE